MADLVLQDTESDTATQWNVTTEYVEIDGESKVIRRFTPHVVFTHDDTRVIYANDVFPRVAHIGSYGQVTFENTLISHECRIRIQR